VRGSRHL